jgi:hypothetical protein
MLNSVTARVLAVGLAFLIAATPPAIAARAHGLQHKAQPLKVLPSMGGAKPATANALSSPYSRAAAQRGASRSEKTQKGNVGQYASW